MECDQTDCLEANIGEHLSSYTQFQYARDSTH